MPASGAADRKLVTVEAGGRIAGVGLVVGVVGGGVAVLAGGTSDEMASIAARAAWVLFPAFAITLIVSLMRPSGGRRSITDGRVDGPASGLIVLASTVGSLAGCGLFLIPATNVPVLLSDAGAVEFRSQLTSRFGWFEAFSVVAAMLVVSTMFSLWARGRSTAS